MKNFFQFAFVAIAAVALAACGGKGENKTDAPEAGDVATDGGEQVYKFTKSYGGSTGTNYASFANANENPAEEELQVEFNGDKAVVTSVFKVKKTDKALEKEDMSGIEADLEYKNGEKTENLRFKIADDKNYIEDFKNAKTDDVLELTMKAETTKDVLEKLNGQKGRYFMMYY